MVQPRAQIVAALSALLVAQSMFVAQPAAAAVAPGSTTSSEFLITPSDLTYILKQIKIAEAHATTENRATLTCTITGLTSGTTYYVDVTATNGMGTGQGSSPRVAVTPAAAPGTPTAVVALGGNGTIVVSWSTPSNNGSPITSYVARAYKKVTGSSATASCTVTGSGGIQPVTSCTITGLTKGTYYVDVTATNAVGPSAPSAPRVTVTVN